MLALFYFDHSHLSLSMEFGWRTYFDYSHVRHKHINHMQQSEHLIKEADGDWKIN